MKRINRIPLAVLVAGYLVLKLADAIFHPLKDLPAPDFNHEYDLTML
jgi:hypothetical protein